MLPATNAAVRASASLRKAVFSGSIQGHPGNVGSMKKALTAAVLLAVLVAPIANAAPFDDAVAAFKRGDYATALTLFTPLAQHGNAIAQYNLGAMYLGGIGVTQNFTEAAKWYRLAAEQGNATAQRDLGMIYDKGLGVTQNFTEAEKWYRLSAEQGNAIAQDNLGVLYFNGEGVPQNYDEALKWYQLSAQQGYASAQYNLGVLYLEGKILPQSYAEAEKCFRLAAQQGDADAQLNLGYNYLYGEGVPESYVKAHMWMNLAASHTTSHGNKKYSDARNQVAAKMTPAQIAEAQALAAKCQASNYNNCD